MKTAIINARVKPDLKNEVEQILSHLGITTTQVITTAIYARLNNDPVRESMEKATAAMMNAGKLKAEVIPIKNRDSI